MSNIIDFKVIYGGTVRPDHASHNYRWRMARKKQKNQDLATEIGKVIRAQREASGMTQAVLAEEVGLEIETISRMETGKRTPTIEKLLEFAEVFRIPIGCFFEAVTSQLAQDLYAQQISAAMQGMTVSGKKFVLSVAQNYARHHKGKAAK
jgi:transcriptional regulator with XRE-family HTH domain